MRRIDCRQEKGSQLMGKNIKPIIPDFKSLIGFSLFEGDMRTQLSGY